ncbi:glycosyltransferase BC10-like [Miscanthus floridulus]|uniref:glycosyltransferase BC10-like n=1 Tax=Miscanthus floridulus TaxID=154761 RepID=UPI003458BCEE
MKPGTLKSRRGSAGDEEEAYIGFPVTPRKDYCWSSWLLKAVVALVILMAGVLIGLSASANVSRYYYYSSIGSSSLLLSSSSLQAAGGGGTGTGSSSGNKNNTNGDVFASSSTTSSGRSRSSNNKRKKMTEDEAPPPPVLLDFRGFVDPGPPWGHSMSDPELFWRASMAPRMEEYPFQRVPKVAFLFLTRGPLPFAPLWERFFHGHEGLYSVYVHALPGYAGRYRPSSPFHGRQIPSGEVSWGSITLVDAEKRLLANALLDWSNQRFVLVSESCVPVFNFRTVYEYLVNSAMSYVESYNIDVPQCAGRYNPRMAPEVLEEHWRKGSEWFEMSRDLAVDVVADQRYYALFRRHCTPSCYPDEHYIPTFLHLRHGARNANRTVTWVDWSRGGPHPARFGKAATTADLMAAIRSNGTLCLYNGKPTTVCYLFARKFAPSALPTLLNLSTTLLDF